MVRGLPFLVLLLGTLAASAQAPAPPTENVTVTGTKAREVVKAFVDSVAAPTHMTGKIARWETPICPYAVGIQPQAAQFVVQRLKDVAAQAGAPVSSDAKCSFNIEIIFTKTPQALLDNMKKDQPALLGYYVSPDERDRLATVTRPIQAWYSTATRDLRGHTEVDSPRTNQIGQGLTVLLPCQMLGIANFSGGGPQASLTGLGPLCTSHIPYASKVTVTGSRLGDGVRSIFHHVVIVADTGKLLGTELGTVSDYIAMLTLTQLQAPQTCQALPSIVNLLADGCERKVNALTQNDIAYLRGLYWVNPDLNGRIQRISVTDRMQSAIGGE